MARDVIEQVREKAAEALEIDEEVVGVQPLTIKGRNALASWAADTDVAASLPNYLAQHGRFDELVVADDAIPNAFLAAVTPRRVLVFSRSVTGKPKELVEELDLASVTMDFVDSGDRARSRMFVFGMPAGRVFAGECPINGKALDGADRFVEAWGRAETLSMN